MAVETLSPTTHTLGTGTITDPENMYDADDVTFGTLGAAEDNDAEIAVETMPADSDPTARTSVNVRAKLRYPDNAGQYDKIALHFRESAAAAWVKIDEDTYGVGGATANWNTEPADGNWRSFDITAEAGVNPSTGFEIGVQFYNGSVGNPNLPSWDL